MNNLKLLKNIIQRPHLMQTRSSQWYLTRRKVPIEILDEDYTPTDKMSKTNLKAKQLELMKRDRRIPISLETSMRYLESDEYKQAYRGMKVWMPYRRNMKGPIEFSPRIVRNRCIINGFVIVHSACPVCRDKYLVIHPKNVKLLEQFINPATDDVYPIRKIMLCEYTYEELLSAVEIARDHGYLKFKVPFRQFDYDDFYSNDLIKHLDNDHIDLIDDNSIIRRARNITNPTNKPYADTLVPF